MEIILAVIITLVCIEFGIRVIRFAVTGKGGLYEDFAWWRSEK